MENIHYSLLNLKSHQSFCHYSTIRNVTHLDNTHSYQMNLLYLTCRYHINLMKSEIISLYWETDQIFYYTQCIAIHI